ncbi:hypothetical protein BCR42DRAFT_404789 [Absidia repens]|uniref:SMAD/FHA domain-containing protein n=1 Tax=Absidia repens TaxID=90262 RepID=A0A1X2IWL0_9FUNG|nr:hypothetical protein BCR42DRAFT_404789 [Absidia repens]
MGDALCLMFVPPTTDDDEHYPVTTAATTTTTAAAATTGERSSFRRSLNLSNGAFGLRRFSRSVFNEPTPASSASNNNTSHRRSTLATAVPNSNKLHVRIVPNIENPSRSLIFDIFDRDLEPAVYIKIGRFTDRSHSTNHMSFKSKVVSRAHCELWVENEKLFVRDTKSSSGTFLNHIRISPPNQESLPYEIKDGDIVQLGVDYQGGVEEIYRSVKMRFEVNRSRRQRPVSFNLAAFQNIRSLTNGSALAGGVGTGAGTTAASPPNGNQIQDQTASESEPMPLNPSSLPPSLPASTPMISAQDGLHGNAYTEQQQQQQQQQQQYLTSTPATTEPTTASSSNPEPTCGMNDLEECCICLYSLAPHQALFVSPCAHTYHYKCIRPLLESYPGFQCPICRTYSDLDANINLESHEIMEKYGLRRHSTIIDPTSAMTCITTTTATNVTQQQHDGHPLAENSTAQHNPPTVVHSTNDRSISNTSASQPQLALDIDDDMAPLTNLPTLEHMDDNTRRTLSESSARDRRQTLVVEDTAVSTTEPAQHVNNDSRGSSSNNNNNNNNSETEANDHNLPQSTTLDNHIVEDLLETQDIPTSQDPTQNRRSVVVDDNVQVNPHTTVDDMDDTAPQQLSHSSTSSPSTEQHEHQQQRRVNASGFVEKLKMVLFEKRKSSVIVAPRERKRTNRPRPLSYPHFLRRHYDEDEDEGDSDGHTDDEANYSNDNGVDDAYVAHQSTNSSHSNNQLGNNSSSVSASQNLSRQSTTHLAEIEEEEYPWHHHFSQYQPMSIDG